MQKLGSIFSKCITCVWIQYYENNFEKGPIFVGIIIPFHYENMSMQ